MPVPKAIFFDLHGTLIDTEALHPQYTEALAEVCAEHFGGDPGQWAAANRQVLPRWESLLSGLDFRGPQGVRDRGIFEQRAWRAMFEVMGRPLPTVDFVEFNLAHEYEFTCRAQALYPDARGPLERLAAAGFVLHAISDAGSGHIRGCLEGAGVAHLFAGVHGFDALDLGLKQPDYFRRAFDRAAVAPSEALVVEDNAECVLFAHEAGAGVVMLRREGRAQPQPEEPEIISQAREIALAVLPDLGGLPALLPRV
jgi:FMN phosphatase YigB (HAD superfamily)